MNKNIDEILDLVNENDEIIGTMFRGYVYKYNLSNFRVINCFIRNSEGELWIPKRQFNKRMFPDCLDVSCGGHVSSGENYLEAFKKEMMEELNIDIEKVDYKLLGNCNPIENGVSAFMQVYEIVSDEIPNYNPNDFQSYEWIKPEDLIIKLEKGEKSKEDLPKLLKIFYLN